jgi:type IV secretory pathway VirB2 component (pilin)
MDAIGLLVTYTIIISAVIALVAFCLTFYLNKKSRLSYKIAISSVFAIVIFFISMFGVAQLLLLLSRS